MNPYFVTAGEPRRTFRVTTLSEAIELAAKHEAESDAPVRVLEEIDWHRCLEPSERP